MNARSVRLSLLLFSKPDESCDAIQRFKVHLSAPVSGNWGESTALLSALVDSHFDTIYRVLFALSRHFLKQQASI